MLTLLRLHSSLVCLLVAGCVPLLNVANLSGFESDVGKILKKTAVEPRQLDCGMVASTRDGECNFSISRSEAEAIICALKLESVPSSSKSGSYLAHLVDQLRPRCVAIGPGDLVSFGLPGGPKTLRLPGGTAFEYLTMTVNKSTGKDCLQTSHSYG